VNAAQSDVTDIRVLVSGATSGLGRAMSAAMVAGGAHLVLTGRDAARTVAAADELARSQPGRAVGVAMDVRDEQSVADGVAAARDALSGIDVLVNNAGIGMQTVNRRL
jgi:gluconate 5-dehydrogenase